MIPINIINCKSGSVTTFFDGCPVRVEEFKKALIFHPSVKLDLVTSTLDNVTIGLLIKKKLLYVLETCQEISQADIKSNVKTYKNKTKSKISDGLYEFMLNFIGNDCLEKNLRLLEFRKWKIAFVDAEGKLYFDSKNDKIQGFDMPFLDVNNVKIGDGGSEETHFIVDIQLSVDGTLGFNTRKKFITADTYDFMELNGVQDCKITSNTLASNLIVQVLAGCDGSSPIDGLTVSNFKMVLASTGATIIPNITPQGNGYYKFSGAAVVAGAFTIQLYDVTNNLPVTDILNTQFFQSNTLAVVLT